MRIFIGGTRPWALTRREWQAVAKTAGAEFINIEVVCSDKAVHRRRVEQRKNEIENLRLPTWQEVLDRRYEKWSVDRVVVDSAGLSPDDTFSSLLRELGPRVEQSRIIR